MYASFKFLNDVYTNWIASVSPVRVWRCHVNTTIICIIWMLQWMKFLYLIFQFLHTMKNHTSTLNLDAFFDLQHEFELIFLLHY